LSDVRSHVPTSGFAGDGLRRETFESSLRRSVRTGADERKDLTLEPAQSILIVVLTAGRNVHRVPAGQDTAVRFQRPRTLSAFHALEAAPQFFCCLLCERLVDLRSIGWHLHHRPVAVGAELDEERRVGRLHGQTVAQQRNAFPRAHKLVGSAWLTEGGRRGARAEKCNEEKPRPNGHVCGSS
jgi:hypothetical protein